MASVSAEKHTVFEEKRMSGHADYWQSFRAFLRDKRERFFFTPAGAAFFIFALIILIRSLFNRNSYEIVLSCAALLLLLFAGIIGFWKSRKAVTMEGAWKPPFPMTAQTGSEYETLITGLDISAPIFFRLHYIIQGNFFPCGSKNGCYVYAETSVPRGKTSAQMPLDFAMSGIFRAEGHCRLRDIFGFFSFKCGQVQHRAVNVRCAPCFGKKIHINAQSGAEDRRNKSSTDVERYYMREYAPGDRLRDINWKSSDKLDTLITRISTDNQEKISKLEIYFRNFSAWKSLEGLWLLDRAKARLSYFLRSIKEQNSSFVFDVRAAQGNWEIEDDEDLDLFLEELAALSFLPPVNETVQTVSGSGAEKKGDIYVFSTACDSGLQSYLLACNHRPVTLFLLQPPEKSAEQSAKTEPEFLRIGDFNSKGCILSPRLLKRGNIKPLAIRANKIDMYYAGIKL
ncbi:MAG: DUF58 domain-containing protein [Treponema sp.]|nr:DUF58 domain-containing protein [Treponema sp.]